ncbi:2-succinyl-5-enolpyruvyl-6-hydroxy-3-cyclohexene-1-carboxylic-acid synthase [Virgibacillus siamensis]|uniref:2-succinyl-5-enolpyruvyl-6-hydroxy-3- cyclohexene-1-carboxylic-acid synthase n=1 Tax=Virgibacillus siamensis TaxID=480071 RepID=UPI000985EAF0|nr:2-succinyl-5-enolpyruvyl-6-hydroxy-3-cyclohexene-1-carboxylic-acid synthase [Virgibacillus siamensis]
MNHTEKLSRYIANFTDELVKSGLTDVVISPGSRSTPLAMTLSEHPEMSQWVILDERSAAFFALGMAKKKKRPVAIVCTSGTAAANYFPAIVEAYYSRVPLVVLTSDRPHELRDVGAPQSIGQLKLFGDYAKWFHEMALPEAGDAMLHYVRSKASRAVYTANAGNAGPVHLNFPLREPLVPDFTLENLWGDSPEHAYYPMYAGSRQLSDEQVEQLSGQISRLSKGLIVCGPQTDRAFAEAAVRFATAWKLPILADPLSQLRAGNHAKDVIIEGYDAILRNETIRNKLKPDYIIRFGAMPVSKPYLFFVKEHGEVPQFIVEQEEGYREPAGNRSAFIYADPAELCNRLAEKTNMSDGEWLRKWQSMNDTAKCYLLKQEDDLTEGSTVRIMAETIPDGGNLYVGNSMAIRDVDTFFETTSKSVHIMGNRGANGIDGMVSSGLGAAASSGPTVLLLGDLSFFHDSNGLLAAKQYHLNITILLINNDGGGIFSFLPQNNHKQHFEALFGTPMNVDFSHLVNMYGGNYVNVRTIGELKNALDDSYQYNGLSVIEVKTDRTGNMQWHREKWDAITNDLLNVKE